jgi:8-oxo-dGTP diphosphatase
MRLAATTRAHRSLHHASRIPTLRGVTTHVIPCVGAVIRDGAGRLLLIKRGHEPGKGLWSIPGGRVEPGESDESALVREVREETGLAVRAGGLIGAVRRPAGAPGAEFHIRDYAAQVTGGTLAAGDDADDAMWASGADLDTLPLTDGLLDTLRSWGVL